MHVLKGKKIKNNVSEIAWRFTKNKKMNVIFCSSWLFGFTLHAFFASAFRFAFAVNSAPNFDTPFNYVIFALDEYLLRKL